MTEGKTVVLDNQQFLLARPKEMVYLTTNSFFCVKKSLLIRGTFKAFTFNYEAENKPLDKEGVTLGPRATFGPKRQIFYYYFFFLFSFFWPKCVPKDTVWPDLDTSEVWNAFDVTKHSIICVWQCLHTDSPAMYEISLFWDWLSNISSIRAKPIFRQKWDFLKYNPFLSKN